MSCPTCSHTMEKLTADNTQFWCPRCGTLLDLQGHEGHISPKLVARVREYEATFLAGLDHVMQTASDKMRMANHVQRKWISLGIAESIRPEGERYGDDQIRQKERAKDGLKKGTPGHANDGIPYAQ